jgi:hypothetical protein
MNPSELPVQFRLVNVRLRPETGMPSEVGPVGHGLNLLTPGQSCYVVAVEVHMCFRCNP